MSLVTLKKNREFKKVYNARISVADRYLVMYIRRTDATGIKFGYSISKKVGKAVQRNLIRRRLKEICRLKQGYLKPGTDVILVARVSAADADYKALSNSFLGLAKRSRILKKES